MKKLLVAGLAMLGSLGVVANVNAYTVQGPSNNLIMRRATTLPL